MTSYSALVIDDNWYNRDIFRIALENAGYEVMTAEEGITGLSTLEKRSFDLLVLDLQMPQVDGQTVLTSARANPLHEGMRVVVVTANAHMATPEVHEMADHVMLKPVDIVDFAHFASRMKPLLKK